MIIDVIDMEDPELAKDRQQQLTRFGARTLRLVMYGMSNGVAQVISEIANRAPAGGLTFSVSGPMADPAQTFTGGHGGKAYRVAHWTGISVANIRRDGADAG